MQTTTRHAPVASVFVDQPLGALTVVPPTMPSTGVSAAAAREIIGFARHFEGTVSGLTRPYYVHVPSTSELGAATLGSFLVAYIGLPLVALGAELCGLGDFSKSGWAWPVTAGVIAAGPLSWAVSAVKRQRQRPPRATPLEAQSLRDAVIEGAKRTPYARAVVAEILSTRLLDATFVAGFDDEALKILLELANDRPRDPTVLQLVSLARFLSRGTFANGAELDSFNAIAGRLPPELAAIARELGRELVLAPATAERRAG